ncbi:MAG: hypothetical protein JNM00_00505, partial [Flavobacteriales bacterium]|nr:hypothetical protein [Flavobacteriales bacterium]
MNQPDFSEFTVPGYDEWRRMAARELRDTPFEAIVWESEDGLKIDPYPPAV